MSEDNTKKTVIKPSKPTGKPSEGGQERHRHIDPKKSMEIPPERPPKKRG